MNRQEIYSKIRSWFLTLSQREKIGVGLAGLVLVVYMISLPFSWFSENYDETQRLIGIRKEHLRQTTELLARYSALNEQLVSARANYDRSQMSYGDVIARVQQVVQQATNTQDVLELNRMGESESVGLNYRKERFALRIPSIELNQLVEVLYQLEHGDNPLFLERLELNSTTKKGFFRIALSFSSIQKQQEL